VREKTSLPLPTVLAWSDDAANDARTEYIILEHAPGTQLHRSWEKMNGKQHMRCIRKLVEYMRELSSLSFPAYGSLYFDDAPIPPAQKISIGNGFSIGPNCHPNYWPHTPGEPRYYNRRAPNQGPCRFFTFASGARLRFVQGLTCPRSLLHSSTWDIPEFPSLI
jgi:hypothetical protein